MSRKAAAGGWKQTYRALLLHHALIKGGVSKALIDSVCLCGSASRVKSEISVLFKWNWFISQQEVVQVLITSAQRECFLSESGSHYSNG